MTSTKAFLSRSMMSASERAMGRFMRNADGHEGGAPPANNEGGTPPADAPKSPESVLFPKEGEPKAADPAGDKKPDDAPADWKEYVNDPTKSEAENTAAKAEHDKTKPKADAKDAADTVPEDGKYQLTMPEGVEVDQALLDAVSPRFKELGLTTKQAQALTDDFVKLQQQRLEDYAKTPAGAWSTAAHAYFQKNGTPDAWVDTAKADKTIGGDAWDATVKTSRRAVDQLGTPALKEYLEASGGGNHPELIRFMAKVGSMIKEDTPAAGGAGGQGKPADAAHVLFPSDVPKG